ncbi:Maltose/maltodextrin transport ATP-binding protein MalK; Multiple sugar ABC transporter,ATP-binding protein [Staphylococcus piscifermentans]|uniref:Sugar ABC transporter ATP-binding protein n=1 Tax=Staphylococcus piscifermentans TaxID=70258 RepID=A0A239TF27_9STAP|nr:sn-glycerol-3-phosphate ABC transporter ATP-binding protein UgpC [Staphylococcus piscifermentans]RTX85157.1 sn-glycerol-3-phosphate ABC transporter ATP-binding protein UgpC [Staphylococcus piscifermentans]GEP83635.1 sugar ABC transporter ATP-binding protein [Staphylococcus piscifermentans]SNU96295.1 Maltose/maltodextrin transport ATP-binding protein MalK; Multiple sugar ABC transporter,ATP-binding protein [Staphylococcus piscifermentans]
MAELKLEHIKKVYDNHNTVVNDFNLHIKDKEFIVFVGPSGCGKSTTLRMIAGLESITGGDFYIDDARMNDVEPKNRDIAMVFQNYALYPHMTVFENMAFGLKLRKVNKQEIKKRVDDAAEILGLTEYLNRKPKALSGGQRQRVALGRAIVRDAKVFLMDEPLSNLDAKLRVQMRTEILKLHKRLNTTTIYVTHDQTEALTMATRIVVLKDGDIMQVGSPREIYDTPDNIFVAQFIGSPAMNVLDAEVTSDGIKIGEKIFNLDNKKFENLKNYGYENKTVVLGIRAEDIHEEPIFIQSSPGTVFKAEVIVSELLGSEIMVHSMFEGFEIIAKLDSRTKVAANEKIELAFDLNKSHFFDKETGNRIV